MKVGTLFATIVCCDISLFTDMLFCETVCKVLQLSDLTQFDVLPARGSEFCQPGALSPSDCEATFVLCFVDMAASMALPDVAEVPGLFPLLCEATKIRVRIVDMHDGA